MNWFSGYYSNKKKEDLAELVENCFEINIPFTVGGGIETIDDAALLIRAGADKISINTSAFRNPYLITKIAKQFGSQCVVVAIDTRLENNEWIVNIDAGRTTTGIKTLDWALKAEKFGAGEILLTSMNADGTKSGFSVRSPESEQNLNIPVIASEEQGRWNTPAKSSPNNMQCSPQQVFSFGRYQSRNLRVSGPEGINVRV
jgi:cyclase